jgi:hypothetical protein
MAKGLFAGMTDYSHQSFDDLIGDLKNEIETIDFFVNKVKRNLKEVEESGYWNDNVPTDFKSIIGYALRLYNTTKSEFNDIIEDIQFEVSEHHCVRLNKIAETAQEVNVDIGQIWHNKYDNKEYGNDDFRKVEDIYGFTRDVAANLTDTRNISERLKDFIGRSNKRMIQKNNPWNSGSFYLFVAVVVISGLAVLSNMVDWIIFPLILIGGILLIGIIGAFQLKNDDKLKDESFLNLIKETYQRLPLLRNLKK